MILYYTLYEILDSGHYAIPQYNIIFSLLHLTVHYPLHIHQYHTGCCNSALLVYAILL